MPVIPFEQHIPDVSRALFIAPDAWITGQVSLADGVSVFFGCSLRGDLQRISVGRGSNLQESALLHTSVGLCDCVVGEDVTVGHHAILHGCTIKNSCIIGMGATILDEALIEEECIIGANSLVSMGTVISAGSLAYGSPAKVVRKLTPEEIASIHDSAARYRRVAAEYARQLGSGSKQG